MKDETRDAVVGALNELTSIAGILKVMAAAQIADVEGLSACDVEWLADQQERIITDVHVLVSKREPTA